MPGKGLAAVAVPAPPGTGQGWWAGSARAAQDDDGTFVIA